MLQSIDPNLQLILNSIQLAIFVLILVLSIIKVVRSQRTAKDFFTKFYSCVTVVTCINIGVSGYEIAVEAQGNQPQIYALVIANVYLMGCEAITVLFLSDYWHETKEIITKTSTEGEIREESHWLRHGLLIFWGAAYTAYIAYALSTHQLPESQTFQLVLALGCQGIAATILLWAILLQVMRGHYLSSAVGRYEQWLNSTAINKGHFRCLYWVASILNFLRVLFLITVTIMIQVYGQQQGWGWMAVFIYTASGCIVLLVYIFGFSADALQENDKVTTLLQGRLSNSTRSRHETELSSSASNRSHH